LQFQQGLAQGQFCDIFQSYLRSSKQKLIQSVPEKMRLEMLAKTQIEILDGQSSYFFSNEHFKKRPGMTIEDFGLHSDAAQEWRSQSDRPRTADM